MRPGTGPMIVVNRRPAGEFRGAAMIAHGRKGLQKPLGRPISHARVSLKINAIIAKRLDIGHGSVPPNRFLGNAPSNTLC